ncbi:hypothetical protein GCM10017687_63990 [Streptomyces echinatus]|uniref:hypothetical protein n=1 Tax=Streptomyces echinatus TaxID=67293 RepID=UPI0031E79AB6
MPLTARAVFRAEMSVVSTAVCGATRPLTPSMAAVAGVTGMDQDAVADVVAQSLAAVGQQVESEQDRADAEEAKGVDRCRAGRIAVGVEPPDERFRCPAARRHR